MSNSTENHNNSPGPLAGLKILDLTEHMAGPFCTMILADMGAEVIKLERPGKGDSSREMGDGSPRNAYFRYINRNKKSITLNYKHPAGRELFLKLAEGMDILVENYRPTVMPRAELGYAVLREITGEGLPPEGLDPLSYEQEQDGVVTTLVRRGEDVVGVSGSHDIVGLVGLIQI